MFVARINQQLGIHCIMCNGIIKRKWVDLRGWHAYQCSQCGQRFLMNIYNYYIYIILFDDDFNKDEYLLTLDEFEIYRDALKRYLDPVIYCGNYDDQTLKITNTNINDVFDCGHDIHSTTPEKIVFGDD